MLRIPLAGGQYNWYVLRATLAYNGPFLIIDEGLLFSRRHPALIFSAT